MWFCLSYTNWTASPVFQHMPVFEQMSQPVLLCAVYNNTDILWAFICFFYTPAFGIFSCIFWSSHADFILTFFRNSLDILF